MSDVTGSTSHPFRFPEVVTILVDMRFTLLLALLAACGDAAVMPPDETMLDSWADEVALAICHKRMACGTPPSHGCASAIADVHSRLVPDGHAADAVMWSEALIDTCEQAVFARPCPSETESTTIPLECIPMTP
jgi:hypothetical protein